MSTRLQDAPHLSADEYFASETISPFKHEFVGGVMYAMGCESAADYLEMEKESPFRHEYMAGVMYAMAGGGEAHQILETNLHGLLFMQLRGRPCRVLTSNMKLRLPAKPDEETEFCYPDAMVCCDPTDGGVTDGHAWRERPSILFEITSPSTQQVDERRKREAYLALPSLEAYVRLEQDRAALVIERRVGDFWRLESIGSREAKLGLPSIGVDLSLAELYEGVPSPSLP